MHAWACVCVCVCLCVCGGMLSVSISSIRFCYRLISCGEEKCLLPFIHGGLVYSMEEYRRKPRSLVDGLVVHIESGSRTSSVWSWWVCTCACMCWLGQRFSGGCVCVFVCVRWVKVLPDSVVGVYVCLYAKCYQIQWWVL